MSSRNMERAWVMSTEIKARVIGCQYQMKSFNFFFSILLIAIVCNQLYKRKKSQTVETLKRIGNDIPFDTLHYLISVHVGISVTLEFVIEINKRPP